MLRFLRFTLTKILYRSSIPFTLLRCRIPMRGVRCLISTGFRNRSESVPCPIVEQDIRYILQDSKNKGSADHKIIAIADRGRLLGFFLEFLVDEKRCFTGRLAHQDGHSETSRRVRCIAMSFAHFCTLHRVHSQEKMIGSTECRL